MNRYQTPFKFLIASILLFFIWGTGLSQGFAQPDRGWTDNSNDPDFPGKTVRTRTLTLHPCPEPRPALKYRLIPSEFNQLEGNAAVHYLRAMGFFEQTSPRQELDRIGKEASKKAREEGLELSNLSPYSWQRMSPDELPLEEVKKYLQLTDFQAVEIAQAHKIRLFDLSRRVREVESPISILLSEVQQMRELARTQSLRCRVAIAEGRTDDAIQIVGQQFRMANHLSQEPFLVSSLVGIAIAGIGWDDALYLVQSPQAPNLFWAIASLPKPLVPLRFSASFERELLGLELRALNDVDEQIRPVAYWQTFIDRILLQYNRVGEAFRQQVLLDRQGLVNAIAAGYPGAKRYLIEDEKMDAALVESFTTAQTFFLAQKKYSEFVSDEGIKWSFVDISQRRSLTASTEHNHQMRQHTAQVGWAAMPADMLSPAFEQIEDASARTEMQIAMLQAIEGLRLYAAQHEGELPRQLTDLPYPVRLDPFTGQPLNYEVKGELATLTGGVKQVLYKINLQIAKPEK